MQQSAINAVDFPSVVIRCYKRFYFSVLSASSHHVRKPARQSERV